MPRAFPYESVAYPFKDSSTFVIEEELLFPKEFLRDAHVYARKKGVYGITSLVKKGDRLDVTIGLPSNRDLIFGSYELSSGEEQITLTDSYLRWAGVLLVDTPATLSFLPDGEYTLGGKSLLFEASCHVPAFSGSVEMLIVIDEDPDLGYDSTSAVISEESLSYLLTNRVKFIGTHGVVLEHKGDSNELIIHFVGEPYGRVWEQSLVGVGESQLVSSVTINVVNTENPDYSATELLFPDENGNIPIFMNNLTPLESDALRIQGKEGELSFKLLGKR